MHERHKWVFTITVADDVPGQFVICSDDDIITQGRSIESALENMADARSLMITGEGRVIPSTKEEVERLRTLNKQLLNTIQELRNKGG